jgi:phage terminase large subunit
MTPFKTSRLFDCTYSDPNPIIIHCGGTSSGKTYSILQVLLIRAITEPERVITVVGQDIPNLKKGSYRDIQNIINASEYCQYHVTKHNDTDRIFWFRSGSLIEFVSFADAQDAKNGKRDYLFCNEMNGIAYDIFMELQQRTTIQVFGDFNPTAEFWAHEKLKPRPDVSWYVTNFKHNPFIKEKTLRDILSYEMTDENIARGTADEWRWKVYGLGELGRLEGVIFEKWDFGAWPTDHQWHGYGLDFGFTNDPTGLVEVCVSSGELFIRELIYEHAMTNGDISTRMASLAIDRRAEVVCDSAEPKSIEELYRLGWNVHPAIKGADSIQHGIDTLKRYKLNVCGNSPNLARELRAYRWKTDRNGKALNVPIDTDNHLIDAIRYIVTYKLKPKIIASQGGALV